MTYKKIYDINILYDNKRVCRVGMSQDEAASRRLILRSLRRILIIVRWSCLGRPPGHRRSRCLASVVAAGLEVGKSAVISRLHECRRSAGWDLVSPSDRARTHPGAGRSLPLGLLGAGMSMFQINPKAIPFLLAGASSAVLALFAWRRREMPRAPAFATMMAGEMVWAFAEALELIVVPLTLKILCISLRVLGAVISILGMLGFVLRFTDRTRLAEPRSIRCDLCLASAPDGRRLDRPLAPLFWTSVRVEQIDGFQIGRSASMGRDSGSISGIATSWSPSPRSC